MTAGIVNGLLVFCGGGVGALLRWAVTSVPYVQTDKYLWTLAVNLSGCLAIGIVWALLQHLCADRWVYLLAITGVLGGYTTFSAFSLETMQLFEAGRAVSAIGYVAFSVIGGIMACAAGLYATQYFIER